MALELPDRDCTRELIKCVVIGDSGVGKTKLICAQALGQSVFPEQRFPEQRRSLLQCSHGSHTPSVFAIDKYYKSAEIQSRSNMTVDGVRVALRLWDTFGDHQKNRRFAYQHSHVVALCFAVNCPPSLESVNNYWYKEIKNFCPRAPIILVGTKADCRMQQEPEITRYSSFSEQIRECSMVSPEMGRQVAKEIGANYYECSSLTMVGLDDVFHNIIRAALCSQRARRLLSKQLRKVLPPQIQVPYKPPKPQTPQIKVPPSTYHTDLGSLLYSKLYYDVVFTSQGKHVEAHGVILAAASSKLPSILSAIPHEIETQSRSCEEGNSLLNDSFTLTNILDDGRTITLINIDNSVSFQALYNLLEFLYTGEVSPGTAVPELLDAACFLNVTMLNGYYETSQVFSAAKMLALWKDAVMCNMQEMLFNKELFSDICFELEGTIIPAHKAILVSRCEMMAAMFEEGHFKEANRHLVKLTDMNLEGFLAVLEYLYTDEVSKQYQGNKITAMALANFFCLPRLVALYESLIVEEIEMNPSKVKNVIEYLLAAEMHNASQLKSWGEHYIIVHYDKILQQNCSALTMLPVKVAETLEARRWPPVWYLVENEWYKKTMGEQESMRRLREKRKWYRKPHEKN